MANPPRSAPDRREPALVEAALLRCALALTEDGVEARALVAQALTGAGDDEGLATPVSETQMFRVLRQAYHSIERTRRRRPIRDGAPTSPAEAAEPRG